MPVRVPPLRHGVGRGGRRRQNIDIGIEWIVDGLQMLQLLAVFKVKPRFDQLKQLAELFTLAGVTNVDRRASAHAMPLS